MHRGLTAPGSVDPYPTLRPIFDHFVQYLTTWFDQVAETIRYLLDDYQSMVPTVRGEGGREGEKGGREDGWRMGV